MNSVPGISVVDSSPEFSLNRPQNIPESDAINFGKLLYGGSETGMAYPISIRSLSRHALLSGINGSGKTNTVQAILNNLSGRIPFLVIEPAKTEYVDWAIDQEFRFRQKLSRYFTNKQSLVSFSHQRESDIHHMGEVVLTFFGSSGFACQNIIRHSTNHQRLITRASCIHVQCWRLHLNS